MIERCKIIDIYDGNRLGSEILSWGSKWVQDPKISLFISVAPL